ncbi:hypothetical protein MLD38_010502 [Melastoma candidum]|uniref:Uncharacterized protein n=1 Tax=Melastoma candidum TaxID=119954 RepID=A0ACB9R158_9MYRT|nr:hypothetical protein MLD38_010502 [Melastoma candidum]
MDALQLRKQLIEYTAELFSEGFLDEQFTQLQQLQDETNPNFVVEVVSLFFQDSERLLNELAKSLSQQEIDFKKIDAYVHQLKGSSSSVGAHRVQRSCISFRDFCNAKNIEGCLECLQKVKQEYSLIKDKLETFFDLEQRLSATGGSPPLP